jgi:hypothetical protein
MEYLGHLPIQLLALSPFLFQIKVANIVIKVNAVFSSALTGFSDYLCPSNYPHDVLIHVREDNVKGISKSVLFELVGPISKYDAFFLHASAVVLDNKAYLFTAPMGVGKSTHTSLWCDFFKGNAFIINDDKPVIRLVNEDFFVFGDPWATDKNIQVNTSARIAGLCFIERSSNNWIEKVDPGIMLPSLLQRIFLPNEEEYRINILHLLDVFVKKIPFYKMGCNISYEAVKKSYEAMRFI